ncbi:MAG: ABC transporter substrate-binding protein [Pseudomonadota bacterium]
MGMFAAALMLLTSACGGQAQVVGAAQDRPTVVSLNPCIDAILVEVADHDQILALSHYSHDPDSSSIPPETARRFEVTGGTAEEVIALKPDLVLASHFITPSLRTALERMSIRVETFGSPKTIDESTAQIRAVSDLVGDADRRVELIEDILSATARGRGDPVSTMLWQPGQIVPGERTLVSELLEREGFVSHSAASGLGQADHVSLEAAIADPPELLLVAGKSAGQNHPALTDLASTRVAPFDPKLFYCGGRSIVSAQERLQEIRTSLK